MQKAVPVGDGRDGGADRSCRSTTPPRSAKEAAQGQVCQAANDNGGGQVVVSGNKAAVERAVEIAKAKGAKRAILLPVSAPFHCALMQPAADAMAEALVESHGEGAGRAGGRQCAAQGRSAIRSEIVRCLVEQVTGTVRWRECVELHGADTALRPSTKSARARC